MKRDMDLVRDLLLKLEAEPFDGQSLYGLEADCLGIEGPSYEDLAYHLTLLIDAGWLDAEREQSGRFVVRKITWAGHDFLDSVRDKTVWERVKARITRAGGGFTAEILGGVAKEIIKQKLVQLGGGALGF